MIANAVVNNCDLMLYEPVDINDDNTYLQLYMVLTAPAAQIFSYELRIDVSRVGFDGDEWRGQMANHSETMLPCLLINVFGGAFKARSFKDISGKPCRIKVEDGKVKAIGNFLWDEWIEFSAYQEG